MNETIVTVAPDVLSITVLLREAVIDRKTEEARPARYPTSNHQGEDDRRLGRKTPDYAALFKDVKDAGDVAIAAGWEPLRIVGSAVARVRRFVPDYRVADAWNLAGCEANALTAAGVWTDDSVPTRVELEVYGKAEGPNRVVIIVERVPARVGAPERKPRKKRAPRVGYRFSDEAPVAEKPQLPETETLPAAGKTTARIRTLDEIKSGDVLSRDEFEANREEILSGGRPRRPEAQPPRARLAQ